jgi:4'-phosphopantetheinyl transferase
MEALRHTRDGARGGAEIGDSLLSGAIRLASSHELSGEWLEVWVLHGAHREVVELGPSCLDRHESRHASLLERPRDRDRYIGAHVALRHVLGHHLDIPPKDVAYTREPCPHCGGPDGRPAVDRVPRPVHFSLSRSDEMIVIGIATAPVGVDVEAVPPPDAVSQVAELLHPAERAELHAAAPSERAMVFTRLWTRKEAYLKGVGVGVAHGLDSEYLGAGGRAAAPPHWSLLDVPVPGPYASAAALRTGPVSPER